VAFDYFTLVEFRALPDMNDTAKYPDARVQASAEYIVGVMEREVSTSFIARTVTGEVHDGGYYEIILRKGHVLSVTSATENGVAITDNLRVQSGIVTRHPSSTDATLLPFASGTRNIAVTYQAGHSSTVAADTKEAAMRATRAYLLETSSSAGVTDRRSTITNEAGTTTYVLAGKDHPTGYPMVDAVIIGWRDKLSVFGFA